mmetsp:Transcript_25568/g.35285  ORF Transcript_25568/g.35285 Transcript_25568/m.35285 type:complete len:852 (+) Transcript_25568:355-2910(+)|eukprot:CAMPEP_0196584438 /NCGR_PEP_ID=MMETSP1081-20130531/47061_1 /TAXON_ID=36882 /ORGANISM="Pyramimonas amylifera, Strain CCMP720" /LENGTH=851 /DNA_ID=CAMNT_0041905643 /DNA_START=350 /DNA_END=2905 /DNA_ORIENTATION=+
MDITTLLLNAQNPDPAARKAAEETIQNFQETDYGNFFLQFVGELANNDKPIEVRTLAGLILKNALDAKDEARKKHLQDKWVALDANIRGQVKMCLLATLQSPVKSAGHTTAQVVAKVASIELPLKQWPELLPGLMSHMQTDAKQATLESLGYICEELDGDILEQAHVDQVLTAVVQGMRKEEPDNEVRLAAATALYNALDFVEDNFKKDQERNYIMQVTCEATQCQDTRVRRMAFECLVQIHNCYYEHMAPYISDVFNLTVKATREDEEEVALQAIELWSTLCEVEMNEDLEDSADNRMFVKQALPGLVPMILETLTKQEEGQDGDDSIWNLSMAGGTCLGLIAQTVCDDIVPHVLPFVEANAMQEDWHRREAALFAFGSILEGPKASVLDPLVRNALGPVVLQLKDPNTHIKDTTAWMLARVCEFVPSVLTAETLPQILSELLGALNEAPHVAQKVCWAVSYLAAEKGATMLAPYFQNIVQCLLQTAERTDAEHSGLRTAAYDALDEVVHSTEDTMPIVYQLLPSLLGKLQGTLQMAVSTADERQKQADLQSLFCGTLQTVIQKLSSVDTFRQQMIAGFADQLMTYFLQVLACQSNSAVEDAMQAIDALILAMGKDFIKYMEPFYVYLDKGLKNFQDYQVCLVTVGLVGDISRSLGMTLPKAMWDQIVWTLLENLGSDALHRSVKPAILSAFGDIALALGATFESYLQLVMTMLQHASKVSMQSLGSEVDGEEELEHMTTLRASILEAYAGIFQGLKERVSLLEPHVEPLVSFIAHLAQDPNLDDQVAVAAVGVLGDLAQRIQGVSQYLINAQQVKTFILECTKSSNEQLKDDAEWAKKNIEKQIGQRIQ